MLNVRNLFDANQFNAHILNRKRCNGCLF